jgi:hypothetical protein
VTTNRRSTKTTALPNDTPAEAAVLGSMIYDPTCIGDVVKTLRSEMFFLAEHRTIFSTIVALHNRNHDVLDGLLVRAELEHRDQLDAVGGPAYLNEILQTVPSSASVQYYADIVVDRYSRRQAWQIGSGLMTSALDPVAKIREVVNERKKDLDEIGIPDIARNGCIAIVNASSWLASEPCEPDQIVAGTFDRGDKVVLIGSPKVRKSFALLQLMESLAAGRDCWGWSVPKARRVVGVQFEIQAHHFHRRVRRVATALGLTPADIGDRLQIINARGLGLSGPAGVKAVLEAVQPLAPDVICLDPLYKILEGRENAAEDLKVTLNLFDELAEVTGAAIVYVHHDPKGFSGDRDIRDRGAGSNVLGRDYDACIALTPHASEPDAVVVETLLRNYRPQEPVTIAWTENAATGGYCFDTRSDLAPTKQTSTTARKQSATPFEMLQPVALELLAGTPMAVSEFKSRIKAKAGLSRDRTDEFTRWALLKATPPLDVYETRGKGKHVKYIGTAEQILQMKGANHD